MEKHDPNQVAKSLWEQLAEQMSLGGPTTGF